MTKEYFLERAKTIYGDLYDYSMVKDISKNTDKVDIICKIHGKFTISVFNFLSGRGCTYCGLERRRIKQTMSTEKFIEEAKKVHGNKYDYNKVDMYNRDENGKVCIICPIHGEFWQTPYSHIRQKEGCLKCGIEQSGDKQRMPIEVFIKRAKEKHGDRYDYSKVEYINYNTKVCIYDKIKKKELWQTPYSHLKCEYNKCYDSEDFKNKLIERFGEIYDFSVMNFVDMSTKVTLLIDGREVTATPSKFISSKKPIKQDRVKTTKQFVEKARKIHGNRYNYSKVNYINRNSEVCIICPEHGEFWQKPYIHLDGCGCKSCKISTLEYEIKTFLEKNNINFIYQYYPSFLSSGFSHQSLDFYLPEYNIAIECQGRQHFEYIKYFKNTIEESVKRDSSKFEKCNYNDVNVFYFIDYHISLNKIIDNEKYNLMYNKQNTFKNKNKLLSAILKIKKEL